MKCHTQMFAPGPASRFLPSGEEERSSGICRNEEEERGEPLEENISEGAAPSSALVVILIRISWRTRNAPSWGGPTFVHETEPEPKPASGGGL